MMLAQFRIYKMIFISGLLILSGCTKSSRLPANSEPLSETRKAIAVIYPASGQKVHGVFFFEATGDGIKISGNVEGLNPKSKHGFHIHEFGDCSAPDFSSAGAHYNPIGRQHAGPENAERHAGDMGNLESNANGVAAYNYTFQDLTLVGGMNPILGRTIIIHEREDNLVAQPSGNAGNRIGCAVIGIASSS